MSQPVGYDRIVKFWQDRKLLPYNDIEVAARIKVDKSNYSSYVNGRYPITNNFLRKFYAAFGDELKNNPVSQLIERKEVSTAHFF